MSKTLPFILAIAAVSTPDVPALAQVCPVTPHMASCAAAPPPVGARFSGPVLQVMDGSTLCVALGPTPERWVKVRLADAEAGVSRAQLMTSSFARRVECAVVRRGGDGVVAVCKADGVSLARTAAAVTPPPKERLGEGAQL